MFKDTTGARSVPLFDRLLRRAVDRITESGPPFVTRQLTPLRAAAAATALARHRAEATHLQQLVRQGDRAAREQLAQLAATALAQMRAELRDRARAAGPVASACAAADRHWNNCHEQELMDDPALEASRRSSILATLDSFNNLIGCYDSFLDALLPMANPSGTTRVLDLAAGHGGFALATARCARARGLDFTFTASDLQAEYLELGAAIAQREQLPVEFSVQDALDLSNIAPDSYDIIVCTQTLHHFPAGLVALMVNAATAAASRGVVFIDGCRSALSGVTVAAVGTLRLHDADFVRDGWISLRKCFAPEELGLLAALACDTGQLSCSWIPPAHCLLRWQAPLP